MSTTRRMETVGVLALVGAGLAIAAIGSLLGAMGFALPHAVGAALSSAGNALSWVRLGVFLPLVYAVVAAHED